MSRVRSWLNRLGFIWRERYSPLVKLANQRAYCEPAEVAELPVGTLWQERSSEIAQQLTGVEAQFLQSPVFEALKATASQARYVESLAIAHQLSVLLEHSQLSPAINSPVIHWLDIGAKNWSYVAALAHHAQRFSDNYQLLGVELDANRLYADGLTRGAYAKAFARHYPAMYRHQNVLGLQGQYQVISWLLPFVVAEPCLLWGLPLSEFKPQALWRHAVSLLVPHGMMLIINQGEDEAEAQRALMALTPEMHIVWEGWLPETFYPYELSRYGYCLRKLP